MTHVEIKSKEGGWYSLSVDGVDLSRAVLARDFSVTFEDGSPLPACVHMTIAADTLDIDLPESVLDATREGEVDSGPEPVGVEAQIASQTKSLKGNLEELRKMRVDLTRLRESLMEQPVRIGKAVSREVNRAAMKKGGSA